MSLIRLLLRGSRWTVFVATAAGFVAGAAGVGLIALIQQTLASDNLRPRQAAWSFAGLCLLVLLTRASSQALLIRLSQRSVNGLYVRLSRAIMALPLRQIETLGTHRLLATLTEDVPAIAAALLGLPILGINSAILICCFGYMGWLSPLLLAGVLGFLVLGVLSYQLPVCAALNHLQRARLEHDTLMKCFHGLTEGAKELKVNNARREAFLTGHLEATAARLRDRNIAGMTIYAAAGAWGQLLFLICIGLLLFALPSPVRVSPSVITGFVMTILYCVAPVETIMTWLPIIGRARVALRAVEDLNLSALPSEPEGAAIRHEFHSLELDGITHAYPRADDEGFVLGPLDLSLRPGEVTFLVGGNGSGKTTLAKLIVGLYEPASGTIRLNGHRLMELEPYRQLFSVVFADTYLFEHILGMESAGLDARARGYLGLLDLSHKVRIADGRLSTTDLSHGQRKRLALLTAYLEDRPIYVFDEWAADQDPRFKDFFYTRLLPELKARGKAVLVISHDDRYFHVADTLIKLDSGMLEEARPTHDPDLCKFP